MLSNSSRLLLRNVNRILQTSGYCSANVKWDILTAVCVERLPIVTPPLTDMQQKYKKHLEDIEFESSMKCDHEVRHENDLEYAKQLKSNVSKIDLDEVAKVTAQDFEDASNEEYSKFNPASIQTEADKKKDQKSLERDLQRHLVLVVEQNIGKEKLFVLPQGKHSEGETLRQCAERIVKESCGDDLNVQIYGNAPYGFYKYKYPTEENGMYGAKVFFYYGRHKTGQLKDNKKYKWVTRKELETSLPEKYFKSINKFLVEERH